LDIRTPPVLYYCGDLNLAGRGLIGAVGSRRASDEALDFSRLLGRTVARSDFGIVSGAAAGVDRESMEACLSADGYAVGMTSYGMNRAVVGTLERELIASGRLLLVSAVHPAAGFNVGNAMARNKLIYILSHFTVVVATDSEKGGTWAGATENLKHGWVPVYVWHDSGAPAGNGKLERQGAIPIDESNLNSIETMVRDAEKATKPPRAGLAEGQPSDGQIDLFRS
jgi:predicted Rossmann fold nucleotide-binding protein DprA/Smf involved in DNA uptake